MKTGEIEVFVTELRILNGSETPPFYIEEGIDTNDALRLKYRYLDLRRPDMQHNLMMRHKIDVYKRQIIYKACITAAISSGMASSDTNLIITVLFVATLLINDFTTRRAKKNGGVKNA